MKELSIEEKANRYDEVIEMAKSWYIDAQIDFKKSLETLFPELKESEGERIRKRIIHALHGDVLEMSEIKEAVDWLEKQSEEARNIALRTEYEKGRADAIAEMQKEQTQEYLKGADRVQNYKELTKFEKGFDRIADTYAHRKNKDGYNKPWYTQERAAEMLYWAKEELGLLDKQKPTDKVEPKFKIGDIIRFKGNKTLKGEAETHKIVGYDNELYVFDDGTTDLFCEQDLYELVEQKPAWSEEDETIYKSITYSFAHNYPLTVQQQEFVKSLKDDRVICEANCTTIKEWSEEDEINRDLVYNALNQVYDMAHNKDLSTWINKRILSCSQQQWKPSDEQLNNILDVLSFDNCTPKRRELLESLYRDLKKLREE